MCADAGRPPRAAPGSHCVRRPSCRSAVLHSLRAVAGLSVGLQSQNRKSADTSTQPGCGLSPPAQLHRLRAVPGMLTGMLTGMLSGMLTGMLSGSAPWCDRLPAGGQPAIPERRVDGEGGHLRGQGQRRRDAAAAQGGRGGPQRSSSHPGAGDGADGRGASRCGPLQHRHQVAERQERCASLSLLSPLPPPCVRTPRRSVVSIAGHVERLVVVHVHWAARDVLMWWFEPFSPRQCDGNDSLES